MKQKNYLIRICILVSIGALIIYKAYQFKYTDFIFDGFIFGAIAVIGIAIWLWAIYKDFKLYKTESNIKYLLSGLIGFVIMIATLGISWHINSNFSKPSLLKAFYDGDYNGFALDFKADGTFIFDSFCLGSEYYYGTYKILNNRITLDDNESNNAIETKYLKIEIRETEYANKEKQKESYVYQTNENGETLKNKIEFRVTKDNRGNAL